RVGPKRPYAPGDQVRVLPTKVQDGYPASEKVDVFPGAAALRLRRARGVSCRRLGHAGRAQALSLQGQRVDSELGRALRRDVAKRGDAPEVLDALRTRIAERGLQAVLHLRDHVRGLARVGDVRLHALLEALRRHAVSVQCEPDVP